MEKTIKIPFGAKDSELKGWEYTIPEDMEAEEITDSIWRIEYFNVEASFQSCRDLVGFVHEIQHFLNSHIIEKEIVL